MTPEIYHAQCSQRLGQWLHETLRLMVDVPDAVSIRDVSSDPTRSHFIIRVAPVDIPRVLGARGRYMNAMRHIFLAFSGYTRHNTSIRLEAEKRIEQ